MLLAHDIYGDDHCADDHDRPALVIAHGLFGQRHNWSSLAKRLARRRRVVAVDMRNHGDSGWTEAGSYTDMASDLADTIGALAAGRADVLGHSMGGKAAMVLALQRPEAVNRLIVADIAPVAYRHSHARYISAMRSVYLPGISRRSDADPALAEAIPEAPLRAFILQNLAVENGRAHWKPNLEVLARTIDDLLGFPDGLPDAFDGPALFVHGGASDYVTSAAQAAIRQRFPAASIETVAGAGHWLHAERPAAFLEVVEKFLE